MYTIKRAAELVGINATTLRAWERRYGIVKPSRTDGGYRVYHDDDVRALTLMARLVADGWTPSLAAGETRRRLDAVPSVDDVPQTPVELPPNGSDLGEAIIAAAAALNVPSLAAVLDELFALDSHEVVADRHLLPAMEALGDAWAAGRVSVAGEHLAAHAVMRRLAVAFEAAVPLSGDRAVLVGLPPEARHEVGVFAFAVAARRRGIAIDYLGADVPVDDWVCAVRAREPAAVVLAVPTQADVAAASKVIDALLAARPSLLVAVGGREQDESPRGALRLGHEIDAASRALAQLVNPAKGGSATKVAR